MSIIMIFLFWCYEAKEKNYSFVVIYHDTYSGTLLLN